MTLKRFVMVLLTGVVVVASVCLPSLAASQKYGGTLIYSSQNEFPLPDPQRYTGSAQREEMAPVYSTLFQYTDEGMVVNDLALTFEVVNPTLYKVTLRTDVQFHDGTPLRASDVVYSFNRILDQKRGHSCGASSPCWIRW